MFEQEFASPGGTATRGFRVSNRLGDGPAEDALIYEETDAGSNKSAVAVAQRGALSAPDENADKLSDRGAYPGAERCAYSEAVRGAEPKSRTARVEQ